MAVARPIPELAPVTTEMGASATIVRQSIARPRATQGGATDLLLPDRGRSDRGADLHLAVGLQPGTALGATVRFAPDDRGACPRRGVLGLDDCEREHRPLVPDEAGVGRCPDRSSAVVVDRVVLPGRVRCPGKLDVQPRVSSGCMYDSTTLATSAGSHTSVTFRRWLSPAVRSSASRPTKSWSNLTTLPYPSSQGVK